MKNKLFKSTLSIQRQIRITRRLATLLGGGISLPESLSFIVRSIPEKTRLHRQFSSIVEAVKKGQLCSTALGDTHLFDSSLLHMVRIGERSGSLEHALLEASSMLERRDDMSKKIIGVMIYPVFISIATIGIAFFLILYIFPKIIPLVTSMNIPLPFLTRLLMLVNSLFVHHWLLIAVSLGGLLSGVIFIWKVSQYSHEVARAILFRIPILGILFSAPIIIQIFKSLGLLLEHGELLPRALGAVRDGMHQTELKRLLDCSIQSINKGGKLSETFRGNYLFPSLILDLIETGERAGGISLACSNIARIYEVELNEIIQRISRIIEPVLMLGMGGVVGSIALSIVMPIYEITNHIGH